MVPHPSPLSLRPLRPCHQQPIIMASPLAEANANFSLALFQKIAEETPTGNVFFSPLSISSALAMVLLGARGNTATQMSESLHLHKTKDDVHVAFSKLMAQLNKKEAPYALSLANRLYGEQTYEFVKEFLGDTRKHYDAELETVDFGKNYEAARLNINGWVEKQTQDKIQNLLQEGTLDELTKLVLVNAIYFKGSWEKKFKDTNTRDTQFKLNQNESKPVKMMYQKTKFPLTFIPEANCQILELPYVGKDLSMLIMLPNEITGLTKLEKNLSYENFIEWTRPDMMDMQEVQVGLPRFKLEQTLDLGAKLTSMGMMDAFDQDLADFSGMSPRNDLVLSKVIHKAFVEVNEEGTEAAAATAAIMMLRCAMMPASFIADHPFLFFIRHNPTNSVLFYGRYCSP
ncbi:leukocyte elastase inhibitor-like isoform X2 [Hypomesus transpacificus]|uniref:leukocyte elastase inhibitor-like isoform X2 n=1 Tax=Hypomesus transpacificus TaxID=137520 RepID=UPI001F071E9B|nr:leukocyte elastase inhibitor-like isoform X2 [Hypomesus transpacificus]